MWSLENIVLGVPPSKVPISISAFVSYHVPLLVCYVVTAFLAITPGTRALRAALCPIVALLATRAVLSVDFSQGDPAQKSQDPNWASLMIIIALQSLSWMLIEKPLTRHLRHAKSSPSTIIDALDLATNLRGIGWDWSRGFYVPRENRPANRFAFALYTLPSAVAYGIISDLLQEAIKTFITGIGSTPQEPIILDASLPFVVRCLRVAIIATLTGLAAHTGIQSAYDVFTILAVLVLFQDPARWPPLFDNPWMATSLIDFWGRRWHQYYRRVFTLAAYPFTVVLGHAGTIIGAFLVSALLHHFILSPVQGGAELWRMLVGFGMMAPGILCERAFYKLTGRKVGGIIGWAWTMSWILLWGTVITDGFLRAGMFSSPNPIGDRWAVRAWARRLVIDFDAWLHTV